MSPRPPGWLVLCTFGWALAGCGPPDEVSRPVGGAPKTPSHPPMTPDSDGDGYDDEVDCAPEDPTRFPGADEVCNGLDDDCDGDLRGDEVDTDGDGFVFCVDCWDAEPSFYPGADDPFGDSLDQNCDGTDGVGPVVDGVVVEGTTPLETAGWWLAASDVDGDTCAELAVARPGYLFAPQVLGFEPHVSLQRGCAEGSSTYDSDVTFFGQRVEMADHTLLSMTGIDDGYVALYDASDARSAEPVLSIVGEDYWPVDDATLLGSEWVLVGRASWAFGWPAGYRVVSATQAGVVDFATLPSGWAHEVYTDHEGGRVAHIGDRDGDGQIDLGFAVWGDSDHFFPELTTAHIDDAPEIWNHVGAPEAVAGGDILHGAADLDGDGLDDAWIASTSAPGATGLERAGRVYLAPYRGPGVFQVEETAPAEIQGETVFDHTGFSTATGDLDGDGQTDLVVGAGGNYQLARHPGKVMAYLGPLSGVYTVADADALWVGEALNDHAGTAVEAGDFDGSGLADIAVGAPFASNEHGEATGRVYVLLDPLAP